MARSRGCGACERRINEAEPGLKARKRKKTKVTFELPVNLRLNATTASLEYPQSVFNKNSTLKGALARWKRELPGLSGDRGAFQRGSARTRSDADAAHMRTASGIKQMRQTRQMQIDEDA